MKNFAVSTHIPTLPLPGHSTLVEYTRCETLAESLAFIGKTPKLIGCIHQYRPDDKDLWYHIYPKVRK